MGRGAFMTVMAVALLGATAASAAAATYCVPNTGIANCPSPATGESTVNAAFAASSSGDAIVIGPGTFNEGTLDDGGKSLTISGEGMTQTVIHGLGVTVMKLSAGSSVSDLGLDLAAGGGNTGLNLAGTATRVAITAASASGTNAIGVQLSGGSFNHGTVTLPVTASDAFGYGGVVGNGTLADSTVVAPVGVSGDGSTNTYTPTVHRVRITANQGFLAGAGTTGAGTIDDSLIQTVPGAAAELGLGLDPNAFAGSFTARHVTVIGSGAGNSTGVEAHSDGVLFPVTTTVTLDSSIVRGYGSSISATATPNPDPATTTVNVQYSDYDPAAAHASQFATINADAHSGNADPGFVDSAAGNFHLLASSTAIDAGDPGPLAAGESAADLDGNSRVVAGHSGAVAVSDIGAYEFQPSPPTVSAAADPTSTTVGTPIAFTASGSDSSPGDSVTLAWTFDDGGAATGPSATHAFGTAGVHSATVTAQDLDGFTATATVSVEVTAPGPPASRPPPPPGPGRAAPAITHLKLTPSAFAVAPKHPTRGRKHHHGTLISYRDTQPARTRLTVWRLEPGRMAGRSCAPISKRNRHRKRCTRYVKLGSITHADAAGANRLAFNGRLNGRALALGRYRLEAIPRNLAGAGRPVFAGFRIVRRG